MEKETKIPIEHWKHDITKGWVCLFQRSEYEVGKPYLSRIELLKNGKVIFKYSKEYQVVQLYKANWEPVQKVLEELFFRIETEEPVTIFTEHKWICHALQSDFPQCYKNESLLLRNCRSLLQRLHHANIVLDRDFIVRNYYL